MSAWLKDRNDHVNGVADEEIDALINTIDNKASGRVGAEDRLYLNLPTEMYLMRGTLAGKSSSLSVLVTPALIEFIRDQQMIYGYEHNLDQHYYMGSYRDGDGRLNLQIKYQHILGSRHLATLNPEQAKLFTEKVLGQNVVYLDVLDDDSAQQDEKRFGNLADVIPALKAVEYTNDDCTELKLHGQLPPKVYSKIKTIFEDMGGKWHRASGTHRFDESPIDRISKIIETGKFVKADHFGYFPTPDALAREVVGELEYTPGMRILEPSIGQGHLADVIKELCPEAVIDGYELTEKNHAIVSKKHNCTQGDFLLVEPVQSYDAVVMNPPFEKQADIKHIEHAMKFLKPGGQLISIMSSSVTFRQDKRSLQFLDLVQELGGEITVNPEGSFKESGTGVNTVTVRFRSQPKQTPGLRR